MKRLTRVLVFSTPLLLLAQAVPPPQLSIPVLQTEDPADPQQKVQREARAKMFPFSGEILPLTLGPDQEYLREPRILVGALPELPISESDTIVVGRVTDVKVFLSYNMKNIYSEYTFQVDNPLKPTSGIDLGTEIVIVRLGGTARLPGGGIIRYSVKGYGPELAVGSRYLMFLKASPEPAACYAMMKFWNVKGEVITAAFEDDVGRVKQARSVINNRAVADVISIIKAAQ